MAVPLDSPQIDPIQELAGSEIVSFKVDPVLFVHLLTTDNFPQTDDCHVFYAVYNWLVKLVLSASHPFQVRQSPRSVSVSVAEHDRTYGWIRPKR